MKWLREGRTLDDVFARLKEAKQAVLVTDYDGTLAPFIFDRRRATPYPGLTPVLGRIAQAPNSKVIVISGRSIDRLSKLFDIGAPVEMWGTHGWERLQVDGQRTLWPISDENKQGMQRVIDWAHEHDHDHHMELKPASVAFHWRGTDKKHRDEIERESAKVMGAAAEETGLDLHEFDGGRELRVPGRDKGVAMRQVMEDLKGQDVFLAYLGDDLTDEDAFKVMGEDALRVLVRNELRETEADLWLRPPRELRRFFERWHEAITG